MGQSAPVYQPPGANLTYGDVTHGIRALSAAGNPAAVAADTVAGADGNSSRGGLAFSVVAGIEYGNFDELYRRVDDISKAIKPSPPEEPVPEPPIEEDDGIDIGDIIEVCCPNLSDLIDKAEREAKNRLALLGLIQVDAYAKVFESVDLPVLVGKPMAGGAWTFGLNWSGAAKSYSFADSTLDFDRDAALADWSEQYDLMPGDRETVFDIVGDVDVAVDPGTGRVRAILDNDSVLLTKASQTTELSVGYGRQLSTRAGRLLVGAEGKYYDLRLARAAFRYGDITDSEELFDAIRDASFRGDSGFGLDVGLLWVARRYQIGASVTNINEPTFVYPDVDLSRYSDPNVISRIRRDQSYTMERQLKLEGSLFTENRRWSVHFGLDANDTEDPMGDDFQWLTVSGGWTTSSTWLRNARFGYRRNLVGSELSYLSAGITAFRWFNFDLATASRRVEIKDQKLPRSLMLSMGFQVEF